jgi:ABC-type nickel/cobalt efflux system permease component RcnA
VKLLGLLLLGLLLLPAQAAAHPLGNFTVNHYHGITVHPDRVTVRAVVDTAEIPTLQERLAEVGDYASRECAALSRATTVEVDGRPVPVEVRSSAVEFPPGDAGLPTTRLTCVVEAPTSGSTVAVRTAYRDDRIGWREMTAVGDGVALLDPPVPDVSVTSELRTYPDDLLSDPLDVRSVVLKVGPGTSPPASRSTTSMLTTATDTFTSFAGTHDLTPLVGVLAVLLSLVLGASHAALPGHGKTVIAAYLAGRAGTPRDALVVGATVTLTHTAGVLVLGLLISATSAVAADSVLRRLGVVSGLLVAAIGISLLRTSRRHPVAHGHGHGHGHGHTTRTTLIGMGVAGGLVPSPSALVVLLGAVALGRTWFGVLLVVGYGLGMAATLTAVGLLLVRLRDRLAAVERFRDRFTALPTITATFVLVVGIGLAVRAGSGL